MSYWGGCLMCHQREAELVLMVLLSEWGKGTWKQTSPAVQRGQQWERHPGGGSGWGQQRWVRP